MYGKIFQSLFTGSMVGCGAHAFAVWSYIIAHTKPDSLVELNPKIIAVILGESEDKVESAIEFLCQPDSRSRTKEHEGRRLIKQGEFMYFVPTFNHYHGIRNDEERRAYFREKQREYRAKKRQHAVKQNVFDSLSQSNLSTQSESESESESYVGQNAQPKAAKAAPASRLTNQQWIESLAADPAYQGIDVKREHAKMVRWCIEHKKQPTRRRFVNWLNRADKPTTALPSTPARRGPNI